MSELLRECPHCFAQIDGRASVCPSCALGVQPLEPQQAAYERMKHQEAAGRPRSFVRWAAIILAGIILLAILWYVFVGF
jgi:hypothetical protein